MIDQADVLPPSSCQTCNSDCVAVAATTGVTKKSSALAMMPLK